MKNIKALKKDLEIASEKKEKALNNIADLGQKLNPLNTESKYITCRKCGSRLSVEYMRKNTRAFVISRLRCPICYSDTSLYCETSNKRLEAAQHKYMNAEKQEQICKNALDSMLDSIADMLDFESERAIARLVSYLEPVMIVVMAVIVGFIIISVIQPIYGSYKAIGAQG